MNEELKKDLDCIQKDLAFALNELSLVSIKKKELLKDISNERENLEQAKKFFEPLIKTYRKGIEEYEKRIVDFKQWLPILNRDISDREGVIKKQFQDLLNIKLQTSDLSNKIKEKERLEKENENLYNNFLLRRTANEDIIKGLAERIDNLSQVIRNLDKEIGDRKTRIFALNINIKSKEDKFNEAIKIIQDIKEKEKELQARENDIIVMEQRVRPKYFNMYKNLYSEKVK